MRMSRSIATSVLVLCAFAVLAFVAAPPAAAKLDEKEWKAAEGELKRALATNPPDYSALASAVKGVAADQSKRAVDLLLKIGAGLDNAEVFDAVRESLQGMHEKEALDYMIDSADASDWRIRVILCDALSKVEGDGATKAIVGRLQKDKVGYVISAAAKSLGKRRDKASAQIAMPALIEKLAELEKSKDVTWIDVKQALTDITGEDFATSSEWRDFWKARGGDFDPAADRGSKEESSTVVREDEAPKFFKEKIISKRIMFVIDTSGSMEEQDPAVGDSPGGKRIERVKSELIRVVKELKSDVQFNIVAYSHQIKFWKDPKKAGLQKATPEGKADAIKFVSALKADGATHTDEALVKAFESIEINTIVLLSDGAPTKYNAQTNQMEPNPPEKILEQVKGLNRLRGVKIHTFCFKVFEKMGGAEPLLDFMKRLAEENGGKMTLI